MKDPDPLNLRPDDVMVKWRRDAIRDEEARRAAKREQQQREEQNAVAGLRAEMQQEIANLRAEVHQLHELALAACGEVIGDYSNKIRDCGERAIRDMQTLLAQRFGELQGRIDAVLSDPRSRPRPTKDFRFANEHEGDATDLPNPLLRKVN